MPNYETDTREEPLVLPIVHLNGTSRAELERQLVDATQAVREAIDALSQASPNGRDYYPGGPALFEAARKQHERRAKVLRDLCNELERDTIALMETAR